MSQSSPDSTTLKSCPFCGGADVQMDFTVSNWPAVRCNDCGALGPCTDLHPDEAAKAWNTRGLAADQSLSVLIKQYALDLRRNASGGDDYPYEYAKATADYLEELIKRAKGNCTCAQAGFPDSCDNCDGHAPRSWTPDRDAIYRAIENNVRSVPDENFIDRRWMVGINDAIDAILALADTSTDRTWHEAMADRVLQLKIGGAKNLSCDAVLGLIAFIRDGEGSVAVSSPERDPEAERTKLSNERKRLRRWGIGQ